MLFHQFLKKMRARGDYFTVTYSSKGIDFEGRVKANISTAGILDNLAESMKNDPSEEQ